MVVSVDTGKSSSMQHMTRGHELKCHCIENINLKIIKIMTACYCRYYICTIENLPGPHKTFD